MTLSIKKLALATALGLTLHAVESSAAGAATTVVLVHGAFADGSGWDKVVPMLQAKGLKVVSVQNPLTSLGDDVAATKRALDMQSGPVVLVGHSWGGVVITEVGTHERVKALVYVAAFAPSDGQSVSDVSKAYPPPSYLKYVVADKEGFLSLSADGMANNFAQDLPRAQTDLMAVTQGPVRAKNFDEKISVAAWKSKPSWFVLSENDRMIDPAMQQEMSRKIGAKVTKVASSHVPMASHPDVVVKAILAAVAASEQ